MSRGVGVLLALALALAALPLGRAAACTLALAADLPLLADQQGARMVVQASIDGTPEPMMIDTGSEVISITRRAARAASRQVAIGSHLASGDHDSDERDGYVRGVGGIRNVGMIQIDRLALGDMHGAFLAMVDDQFGFGSKTVQGLIGMSLLGNFDVDLDLAAHRLRLYQARGACRQPTVALDQPLYAVALAPARHDLLQILVPIRINGVSLIALLDTGAPNTLIFAGAAERLHLAADGKALNISGVGGAGQARPGQLDSLEVGPLTLRHVPAIIDADAMPGIDLLLGADFMTKVHVWVSNSSHQLVMQYPPAH